MNDDIKEACRVMRDGGLILYPTDTVWGIGCDATNEEAVRKVYDLKQRTDARAMLVLIDNPAKLDIYVHDVPEVAWQLIEAAVDPLTIVYDRGRNLAANLLAEDGSIGIRVTGEAFSRSLCEQFGKPVVSTSANVSGMPSPSCYGEIPVLIAGGVDYVVNYRRGDSRKASPSGIIRLGAGGVFKVIR